MQNVKPKTDLTSQPADRKLEDMSIPSNADIRPFIHIGEAAELALSAIAAKMEKPE